MQMALLHQPRRDVVVSPRQKKESCAQAYELCNLLHARICVCVEKPTSKGGSQGVGPPRWYLPTPLRQGAGRGAGFLGRAMPRETLGSVGAIGTVQLGKMPAAPQQKMGVSNGELPWAVR